jgi:hypothetical protein
MDYETTEENCQALAKQLTFAIAEFSPLQCDEQDFQVIAARFLERYGGSLGLSFLLKHHTRISELRREDLQRMVALMRAHPAMGVDVLLEFYGRFTRVPLEQFRFLDAFGIDYKTTYGSTFFDRGSAEGILSQRNEVLSPESLEYVDTLVRPADQDNYGEWDVLAPAETVARILEQNNLPIEVKDKLQNIVSLNT